MASLFVRELKLASATAAGDQVKIKRLQNQIAAERKKRGKKAEKNRDIRKDRN